MIGLLLAILTALELFRWLPVLDSFRELAVCGRRSTALLARRGVSEWAKERAMRLMSLRLFAKSINAGMLLLAVAAPIASMLVIDTKLNLGVAEALFDWRQRLWILLITVAYALLRWQSRRRLQHG